MRPASLLWFVVACSTVACKSNDSTTTTGQGDVVLEIRTLYPRNADAWLAPRAPDPEIADDPGYPGDPQPIVIGCDRRLGVDAVVENFTLRAPGACTDAQCGTFVVELDPSDPSGSVTARAAAASLVMDLCALHAAGKLEGPHVLSPRLELSDGTPFTSPFAFPPADLDVTFSAEACASDLCQNDANGAAGGENAGSGGAGASAAGAGGAQP